MSNWAAFYTYSKMTRSFPPRSQFRNLPIMFQNAQFVYWCICEISKNIIFGYNTTIFFFDWLSLPAYYNDEYLLKLGWSSPNTRGGCCCQNHYPITCYLVLPPILKFSEMISIIYVFHLKMVSISVVYIIIWIYICSKLLT
jgi:hypothetical protein